MKIVYIKENKNTCDFVKVILIKLKKFFNIIDSKFIEGKMVYYLPILKNERISKRKLIRLSKSVNKKLEKEDVYNVIISEYLGTINEFKNSLYSENINILKGRYLFKCLMNETMKYILMRKNKNIQDTEVSILVNDFSDINMELIKYIAKEIKTLNIITNHINKCKKIEEYLYNEFGILLNISNNKKSSLSKSEIIFNMDFPTELINQYKIYNNAIIINILDKIQIQEKKFNGININYFKIDIPEEYKMEDFKNEEVYEGIIYKKRLQDVKEFILKDGVKIVKLIGNNGYIKSTEFTKTNKV